MPTRNAFASARLRYAQAAGAGPYHVTLQIWSHSFDHPNPSRRSALVTGVFLTQLAPGPGYALSNVGITDRYGVDQSGLWTRTSGANEEGFEGYAEYDTGGACGPNLPNVFWSAFSGIYDERCLADAGTDARRLQTYRSAAEQVSVFNYVVGPLTFAFDIVVASPPAAVRVRLGLIGGNGGNPAQRSATLPDEEFVIQFP